VTRRPFSCSALAALLALASALLVLTVGRPAAARLEASGDAARQDPAPAGQQQPTFRAGVKLVRVDVSVTGKNDEPLVDLQASDFEVEEDGARQRVETLQFVRPGSESPREESLDIRSAYHGEAEAARDDVRTFVIFLDDYHIAKLPAIVLPLRYALSAFVDRLEPTDLVAIVDPLTPLSAIRFTRSKNDLKEVINRFQGRMGEIFPVRSVVEEAQLQSRNIARVRAQVTLTALAAVATRLGGLKEGRKTIIFVSQGPSTFMFSPDGDIEEDLKTAIDSANRGNVVIHVMDPRGLAGPGFGSPDTLYRIGNETGGRTIIATNALTENLKRAANDARAYYLLGYAPTRAEDDGKFHKISVKVKRPGVRVLARRGYWAPDAKAQAAAMAERRPPVPGVAEARATVARSTRRGIAASWYGFSRADGGRTNLTITWDPLESAEAPTAIAVDVLEPGTRKAIEPERVVPVTPAGGERGRLVLSLAPGNVVMRFTARDADGVTIDQWEQPVTIPDLATPAVSLSTPRFHRARSLPELRALQAAADPAPSASREFARGDRVFVDVECYAAAPNGQVEMAAHLLSSDGRELAPLALQPTTAGGVTKARFEVPLGSLGRGSYLLRVRAAAGEGTAEQMAGFSVN
jgi:VWFA-related protein